ncbi:MAG: hypothetical protein CSA15_09730 [Candidatus Delongbacteria bacterium]|nr:MAG: hypothetical protein CSA15_09730 [Candidatus Delongbacteria bacterium]
MEIIKFVLIVICFVAFFKLFLRYLSYRTETKEKLLFQKLAQKTGFTYFDEDNMEIAKKIKGMFDFGLSELPIKKNISGNISGKDIFCFELDDNSIGTIKEKFIPSWSVCLVELPENSKSINLIYFHKNITFGVIGRYKPFSTDWKEVNLGDIGLKQYKLMMKEYNESDRELCEKIITLFTTYKSRIKTGIIPKEVSLQINDKYIAIYTDMWNLSKPKEYLVFIDFMKDFLKVYCTKL